jgi:hypothetical protein
MAGLHPVAATWQAEPSAQLTGEALRTAIKKGGRGLALLPPSKALPPLH